MCLIDGDDVEFSRPGITTRTEIPGGDCSRRTSRSPRRRLKRVRVLTREVGRVGKGGSDSTSRE